MLTVLMATHNGAQTLPRVLDAYAELRSPVGGWQLVVVDNASSDATPDILRACSASGRLAMRVLRTERRGKNVALNEGLRQVAGDLVVLTDDDAVPATDWLAVLREAADTLTDFDIFGGVINPVWPIDPPAWVLRLVNLGATFAITAGDRAPGPVEAAQVWGPNMAIRSSVFDEGHRFDESIGPSAGQYAMGSEVEFTCRIERLGHRAWFLGDAIVGHIIRPQQLERDWIVRRAYRLGRHMYQQERPSFGPDVRMIRGAPRWRYRELVETLTRLARSTVLRDFDGRFLAAWELSFLRGYLAEARNVLSR